MKIINFILRIVYGAVGILVVNAVLAKVGIGLSVGLNLWSLLTAGTLGFSGVALLYGIVAFGIL